MRRKSIVFTILFLLLITSFSLLLSDTVSSKNDNKIYNISIITKSRSDESLMIMKQGIDQAASEFNVEPSFITLGEDNNVEEQKELIGREIKNGADAIIISPVDYEKMAEIIDEAMKKVQVILIESKVNLDNLPPVISCDNYELGKQLGEKLIKLGDMGKKVAIIKNNLESSSTKERYEGFMSIMNEVNNNYINWILSADKQTNYYSDIRNLLINNEIDVIVTFDTNILEYVAQIKKDSINRDKNEIPIKIYGTGSTSKIIGFLEDRTINATATQSEFNMGYLGLKSAVNRLNGEKVTDSNISSTIIDSDNMYSEENQRLLFPLIR